jgi:hypothetical protein
MRRAFSAVNRGRPWVAAIGLSVVLAGCIEAQPAPSAPTAATGQAPAPSQGPSDEDEDLPPAGASPTWDEAARAEAGAVATTAMTAFARPKVDAQVWWAELSPLLTPAAATAYAGTDPRNVPVRKVTGDPVLLDDSSGYLATVEVPTDAGPYLVLLARADQGSPWLVERLAPPQDGAAP